MSRAVKYGIISIILVSFLFFGLYGVITGQKAYVAKIDGEQISTIKFNNYLTSRKQAILSERNDKSTIDFVSSKQFERIILNEMINTIVIHKFLQDNGMKIDEKVVAYYVRTLQSFNKEGKFDNAYFQQYLKYINTPERKFLKDQIPQLEESIFAYMASSLKINAKNLASEYLRSQKRQRNIDILTLQTSSKFEYNEDELVHYYDTIKEQFIQPAKHIVTISYLDDYVNQNVKIFHSTPQNIVRYYNDEYIGKVIKLQYTLFNERKAAEIAYSIVKKQGISLQNVTDTMLAKVPNAIIKQSLDSSDTIDNDTILLAIRNLPKGGVTPIITIGENFYIAQVLDIKETKFSDIREKKNIDKEILQKRKCNNVQIFTEKISQDLQSGLSFEAVSLKYGFPISMQVIVDAKTANVINANTNLNVTIDNILLNHILQNDDTLYGHVITLDRDKCSFAIYKQTKIEPERIQSLAENRGNILGLYRKNKEFQTLERHAITIANNVKSLKNELSSYTQHGTFKNITLTMNNNISPDIFTKPIGTIFATKGSDGNIYVVKIKSETPYYGEIDKHDIKSQIVEIQNVYYNTFLQEWLNLIYDKYNVQIKIK